MENAPRRAVLIVNTHSRRGGEHFRAAQALLRREPTLSLAGAYPLKRPRRLPKLVTQVIADGTELVIVGGGDGTISSIVGQFAGRDVVLGILPLGTANRFAGTLDIPLDLERAVEVIARGRVAQVDLGRVNDHYFANTSTMGLSTAVARTISDKVKRWLGPLAYAVVGTKLVFTFPPFACRITANGKQVDTVTRHVVVANGRSYAGTPVSPLASAEDGLFCVFTMGERSRWQMLHAWLALLTGRHRRLASTHFVTASEVRIETDPVQHVDVDGEVVTRTPAHFVIAPGALRVMMPEENSK